MASKLLTVKEAAALLRIKEGTLLEYLRSGKLEGVVVGAREGPGRRWRVPRESIDRFIQERLSGGCPANEGKEES